MLAEGLSLGGHGLLGLLRGPFHLSQADDLVVNLLVQLVRQVVGALDARLDVHEGSGVDRIRSRTIDPGIVQKIVLRHAEFLPLLRRSS